MHHTLYIIYYIGFIIIVNNNKYMGNIYLYFIYTYIGLYLYINIYFLETFDSIMSKRLEKYYF